VHFSSANKPSLLNSVHFTTSSCYIMQMGQVLPHTEVTAGSILLFKL